LCVCWNKCLTLIILFLPCLWISFSIILSSYHEVFSLKHSTYLIIISYISIYLFLAPSLKLVPSLDAPLAAWTSQKAWVRSRQKPFCYIFIRRYWTNAWILLIEKKINRKNEKKKKHEIFPLKHSLSSSFFARLLRIFWGKTESTPQGLQCGSWLCPINQKGIRFEEGMKSIKISSM
jgi:hypothetical protein